MKKKLIALVILIFLCVTVGVSLTFALPGSHPDQDKPGNQSTLSNQSSQLTPGSTGGQGSPGGPWNSGGPGDQGGPGDDSGNPADQDPKEDPGDQKIPGDDSNNGENPEVIPTPEFPSAVVPAAGCIVFLGTVLLIRRTTEN